MKKVVLLITSVVIVNFNVKGQGQIPDGGFEDSWVEKTPTNGKAKYDDLNNGFLITLNQLYALPLDLGDASLTAFKEMNDVVHGKYSLKLVSSRMTSQYGHVFLPGAAGTIHIDIIGVDCKLGNPFSSRPEALEGDRKYLPVGSDFGAIEIQLKRGGSVIGTGKQTMYSADPDWTRFRVPVTYTDAGSPDEIIVVFASSGKYDFTDIETLMECEGEVGSTLFLDNVSLSYEVGVKEMFDPAIKLSIYPNPSKERLSVQVGKETSGTVVVYDYLIRKMGEYPINGTQIDVDIQDYAAGSYLINVIENGKVITTGRFGKE